jgi:integrase/recombinase XerC
VTSGAVMVVGDADRGFRLDGAWSGVGYANRFLDHLAARQFSAATVRAYAFDLLCLARFLTERGIDVVGVVPTDLFDWIDWQSRPAATPGKVVALHAGRGAAAASVNRRVAAVRSFFEFLVMAAVIKKNPVPAPRRSTGLRPVRGSAGVTPSYRSRGGRLVREARRLPEAVDPSDVSLFLGDLATYRDRAVVLAMLFGGLRAGEVRRLLLADVDIGARMVRVVGKGNKERVVPVDRVFFTEVAAYLRAERPPGCATPECFVVLRGPTRGQPMTEAGMRSVFRVHRNRSGATRVRPHRLRHTYGTELASAGVDLLVLRELMGHASPETTAAYIHLSPETLALAYRDARQAARP